MTGRNRRLIFFATKVGQEFESPGARQAAESSRFYDLLRSHTITVQNRQAALRHSPLLHARDDGGAENCTRRSSTVLPFLFGPRGGFHSEFGQFANLSDSRLRYFFGVAAAAR